MAGLEGSFSTPIGAVPKKAALLVGGGAALLLGIMYFRGRQQAVTSDTPGVGADINPATGFPFGSPEDVAALAAQGNGIGSVGGGGGGGGSDIIPATTSFTNNAQWVQSTIAGMTGSGIIEDASALSVALGKYIAGEPVGDSTTMRSLIEQAIAFNGAPPVAGPNGYPPHINTANPVSTTPPPAPAPYVNPYVNPNGTLSIGAGANLAAAAGSVGLTLSQLAALNPDKYPSNGTVTAKRGMPYKIK